MIQFKEIKHAAKQAFCNDEFYEFLTGRNGYNLPVIDVPIDVPTDWTRIIPHGIYALYTETQNEEIVVKYQNAITRALNGSCKDFWCAFYVLFVQFDCENSKESPFFIDKNITKGVKSFIVENKAMFETQFPFGKSAMSMYDDMLRLYKNFHDDWGYGFLD